MAVLASITPLRRGLASMSDKSPVQNSLSYRDAGVDIDAGDALVRDIAPDARRTRRPGAERGLFPGLEGLFRGPEPPNLEITPLNLKRTLDPG